MDLYQYRNGALYAEEVPVTELAEHYGTPLYVYSAGTLRHHVEVLRASFALHHPIICYSVKACSNIHILRMVGETGAGFDIVSGGELFRVISAGLPTNNVVYASVGKTPQEIRYVLENGILMFNVESEPEMAAINETAEAAGQRARVALRVNPDVDAHTHHYTTTGKKENKFGLTIDRVREIASRMKQYGAVEMAGFHVHIGSQITEAEPYALALRRVVDLMLELRSETCPLRYLNIGGGFGANYVSKEQALQPWTFAEVMSPEIRRSGAQMVMEPGRFIVANASILVTRLLYDKQGEQKRFYIVDAGMNDLIRPSLYDAFQGIWPVKSDAEPPFRGGPSPRSAVTADVVGPICESADFLGKDRSLPPVPQGEYLAVFGTGAYGMAMSSNYNSRPRAAEVMVDGGSHRLIRRRETWEDLIAPEKEV